MFPLYRKQWEWTGLLYLNKNNLYYSEMGECSGSTMGMKGIAVISHMLGGLSSLVCTFYCFLPFFSKT